jgi:hypothetical protein
VQDDDRFLAAIMAAIRAARPTWGELQVCRYACKAVELSDDPFEAACLVLAPVTATPPQRVQ